MKTFKHRSWNHICWTFQSKTGKSEIYLNGELQGSFKFETDFIKAGILGSNEVFESAFIVGQEPDAPSPRGGFEAEQVFVGDITEVNMWNRTLDKNMIRMMGKCKNFDKGNIIAWEMENFIIKKVKVQDYNNLEDLCKSSDRLLVFPQKRSWSAAWTLCSAHGGVVYTPDNEKENIIMINTLKPHKDACADPVSENLAWLGIKSKNYNWYKIGKSSRLTRQNYTPWKVAAPYFENYECGYIRAGGSWYSDANCNKKMKLCTVCKITGEYNL